jgi:pSer/pThr/pTyr-binding forkhead associated (FHA) protein
MGVSRRHSVIRLRNNEVEIFDLGSSNGTSVNGLKLQPHQPQPLRDGDEITLGKMTLKVLFQIRTRRRSTT